MRHRWHSRPALVHIVRTHTWSPMANEPIDTRAGARSTRLGLVALGFAIGVIVTLVILFAVGIK